MVGEASGVEPLNAVGGRQPIRYVEDLGGRAAGGVVVGPVVEAPVQTAVIAGSVGDRERHPVLDGRNAADLPATQHQFDRVGGVVHQAASLSNRKLVHEAADKELGNVGRRRV